MKKIDTSEWKSFPICGENGLFEVTRPVARSAQQYEEGNVPFVASGNFNNGVMTYLKPKANEELDKGGCITISPVDGYAFYQKDDFLGRGGAGSSILILRNPNLNEYTATYICTVIRCLCNDWTYSNMGNADRLAELSIFLPATSDGKPDWVFIEKFMCITLKAAKASLRRLRQALGG